MSVPFSPLRHRQAGRQAGHTGMAKALDQRSTILSPFLIPPCCTSMMILIRSHLGAAITSWLPMEDIHPGQQCRDSKQCRNATAERGKISDILAKRFRSLLSLNRILWFWSIWITSKRLIGNGSILLTESLRRSLPRPVSQTLSSEDRLPSINREMEETGQVEINVGSVELPVSAPDGLSFHSLGYLNVSSSSPLHLPGLHTLM